LSKLRKIIEDFCNAKGISVPSGFKRHTPSRYAVIKKENDCWQLTAKTWFTVCDVINYLDNYCDDVEHKILDFKEDAELKRRGEKQLERSGNIQDVA